MCGVLRVAGAPLRRGLVRAVSWVLLAAPTPVRFSNPDTGEIREVESFDAFVRWYDENAALLGRVAEALGLAVLKRWEDGDESLDLAAEVAAVTGARDGYRRQVADALAAGQEQLQRFVPRVVDVDPPSR